MVDGEAANTRLDTVHLQILGSVVNPSSEDWNDIRLSVVANERDIFKGQGAGSAADSAGGKGKAQAAPHKEKKGPQAGNVTIYIKTLTGKTLLGMAHMLDTIEELKTRVP